MAGVAGKNMNMNMHAIQYKRYGGGIASLQNVEIPIPQPKKDEVLVKVGASSINLSDCKIQKGKLRPFLPFKFPFTPVTDISGEVIQIGSEVTTAFKVGDKVVCRLGFAKSGGLAEYAVASEKETALRPEEVSSVNAAGLPVAGLTALECLQMIGTKFDGTGKGANILITAASGGVGSYAVQLAKLGGHHVTATCGARNVELVRSLGADEVLDYKTPEGESLKNSSGKKYDYIINCAPAVPWKTLKSSLSKEGMVMAVAQPNFSILVAFIWGMLSFSKKKIKMILVSLGKNDLQFLGELMREGRLKTVIDSKYPFDRAQEAWAKCVEGHATGKIIVEM
jgi:NADPH:quinone reductase-like Zn-dependent oxidoreductase